MVGGSGIERAHSHLTAQGGSARRVVPPGSCRCSLPAQFTRSDGLESTRLVNRVFDLGIETSTDVLSEPLRLSVPASPSALVDDAKHDGGPLRSPGQGELRLRHDRVSGEYVDALCNAAAALCFVWLDLASHHRPNSFCTVILRGDVYRASALPAAA